MSFVARGKKITLWRHFEKNLHSDLFLISVFFLCSYNAPTYNSSPKSEEKKLLGSAMNPVLREGNSDRRVVAPVKNYGKKNSHTLDAWSRASKMHVARTARGDFYGLRFAGHIVGSARSFTTTLDFWRSVSVDTVVHEMELQQASPETLAYLKTNSVDGGVMRSIDSKVVDALPINPLDRARLRTVSAVLHQRAKASIQAAVDAKAVFITLEEGVAPEEFNFCDAASFDKYLARNGVGSLTCVTTGKKVLEFSDIVAGRTYAALYGVRSVQHLINEGENQRATRCRYALPPKIQQATGEVFFFLTADFQLVRQKINLGDVDSLFVTADGKKYLLCERKASVSLASADRLFRQIINTRESFRQEEMQGMDNIELCSALYVPSAPLELIKELNRQHVHVITDSMDFYPAL